MNKPNLIPHPAEALVLARTPVALRERLARIKLMVFDVDGVLTDGSLWYGEQGEVFKRFNALDGHGLKMLTTSGIKVALVTGREGPIVDRRAAELGLGDVIQNVRDKGAVLVELVARHHLTLEESGFMGDDLIDLPAMQRAGFAASVPDAPAYVTQAAHWVATKSGGKGAARECSDLILAAQGRLGYFFQPGRLGSGTVQ
ncbi:KdsC family phosphatase [Zwartia vadi]|uniref:KdsC family phosphatase n=1 Tax=Zwartia vadi TaxID=3058168 RepID=UPI0025B4A5C2|nr:HAD-IIIA family hydrolase [Zwartia vadi]MDN3987315.1 HAD-IIIA family hydrolase [Zwartia vadi]